MTISTIDFNVPGSTNLKPGLYTFEVEDDNGVVSLQNVEIQPPAGYEFITYDGTIPVGVSVYQYIIDTFGITPVLGDGWLVRQEAGVTFNTNGTIWTVPLRNVDVDLRFWDDSAGMYTEEVTYSHIETNTAPTLTLVGASTIQLEQGDPWNDPGATANDAEDGNITDAVVIGGDTVNPNVVGTYVVDYDVVDSQGAPATTIQRTVNVVDTVAPTITLLGDNPLNWEQTVAFVDPGATATDPINGDVSDRIQVTGTVDVNTPNTYILTYTCDDLSGNQATPVNRSVIVQDTLSPVITLTGPDTIFLGVGDPYVDQGAVWTDAVDGTGAATVGGDVVNTIEPGTYVVTYNYTDAAGNIATEVIRTVVVSDVALGTYTRVLLRSDFPATYIPTANDLQEILIRLKKLVRRSRPNVARQIENYVYSTYEALKVTPISGNAPDATVPTTLNLKIIYGIFADYLRVERLKVNRLLDVSNNSTVKNEMAKQIQFWLETQGWIFYVE